jgi:hypothetical protein
MALRKPNEREAQLLRVLADAVRQLHADTDWIESLLVESLNDGGMGSLRLYVRGGDNSCRKFGRVGSELMFKDSDGVDVIVSLYLDQGNAPFELDMWKVTYAPVVEIPQVLPPARSPTT